MILKEKNIMLPKIAFQNLGTTKSHLGSQDPGSRKFSCPDSNSSLTLIRAYFAPQPDCLTFVSRPESVQNIYK